MSGLKLAIFDLDGTLVDSRRIIQAAMARAFEENGLAAPDYDQTRRIVGLDLVEACARLAPGLPADQAYGLAEAYRGAFVRLRAEGDGFEPLYPGARELVERLSEAGWLLAIATGKARRGIQAFYDQHSLGPRFDAAFCADDGPGKPHPHMVLEAMKAVGVQPGGSLIVGDAVFDMQMGRAAGVRALGVAWGFGAPEELEAAGAHEVHHDFETLGASLDGFERDADLCASVR